MNDLGIYVHIPFCKSKCAYCDFYSVPDGEALFDRYVGALCAHIEESAAQMKRCLPDTVYFGGGTPTVLGEKRLLKLLSTIKKRFNASRMAEITLEANPESVTLKDLKKLRRGGFNRLSLGAQSHDDAILRAIGRVHTAEQIEKAYEAARRAGFENISLDLMYGLPGQDMESWEKTLDFALRLAPEHLSCYGLKLEPGTALYEARQSLALPSDDQQADLYLKTVDRLAEAGYGQYEISNFARPGYPSRHNLKYWTLGEYLGFGPGAHSDFAGLRYCLVKDVEAYIKGIEESGEVIDRKEEIPADARADEYLMLGLRTARGISGNNYVNAFRAATFEPIEQVLEKYKAFGCALREGDRWRLTARGFLISNRIIGEILDSAGRV